MLTDEPKVQALVGDLRCEVEMRFSLTYDGPLPAFRARKDFHPIRHGIRRQIHKQLWQLVIEHQHPLFSAFANGRANKQIGQFTFVPLVIESLHMVCELDILLLRAEGSGSILRKRRYGGDLDNRLKIFLDALRVPDARDYADAVPELDEHAMFCLLEDDALVTKFQVEADTLLGQNSQNRNDVRVIMRVNVKLTQHTDENRGLAL